MLQPVLVRPLPGGTYELIAGERRWRAAQLAGLDDDPGARARRTTTRESLELALIENMAREDLNPVEEARACALLVEELGLTREEVGRRVGRSRVAVSNLLRLLDLPDEVLELLVDGRAHRGPRPRAADGAATTTTAAGSPAPPPTRAGRCARPRPRAPRGRPRRAEARAARAAARRPPGPGRGRRAPAASASAARSAPTSSVAPRGDGYTVTLAFESLDEALALAERSAPSSRLTRRYHSAPQRAISSVG